MHTLVGLYWLSPGSSERRIRHLFGICKGFIKRRFLEAIMLTFGCTMVPDHPNWIGHELCVPHRSFGRSSREAFSWPVPNWHLDGIHIELEGPDEDFLSPGMGLESPWFNGDAWGSCIAKEILRS
jgi:hypothetical protein